MLCLKLLRKCIFFLKILMTLIFNLGPKKFILVLWLLFISSLTVFSLS